MSAAAVNDLLALLAIPGPPGEEAAVAEHLRRTLAAAGVHPGCITTDEAHRQSEYGGNTGNLIVRLDGHRRGPRRLFSAHMDTVSGAVGAAPRLDEAAGKVVNDAPGKALGGDNRTGCAVLVQVARALCQRRGDHPPATLVFFVQEEVGLVGSRGLDVGRLGEPKPAMGFNFDIEDADEFVTAVIGTERFTIDIEGVAAHSGINPADGVSAALIAAEALAQLAGAGWHGVIDRADGRGTANVGILRGGTGSNVVMPALHILAEARSYDPAFRKTIIRAWREAFERAAALRRNCGGAAGRVRFGPGPTYEAFGLDAEAPVVRAAVAAARRCGLTPRCVSNDGGMDANWTVAHGIPTVTLGAGQRHIHMPAEEVDLRHFTLACRLAVELATAPEADASA
jgi:tripeptide aminopeptidase